MGALRRLKRSIVMANARADAEHARATNGVKAPGKFRRFVFKQMWSKQ